MTGHVTGALDVVTFRVADRWLGLPVGAVQEVLPGQRLAHVPLAPRDVAGVLNLRGQIVTVIDVRARLGIAGDGEGEMHVVVCDDGELFSLRADEVGDVVSVPGESIEPAPAAASVWDSVCAGVVRLDHALLVILDPRAVIGGCEGAVV